MEQKLNFWLEGFLDGKISLNAKQIERIKQKLSESNQLEFVDIPFCNSVPYSKEDLLSITTAQNRVSGEGSIPSFNDKHLDKMFPTT